MKTTVSNCPVPEITNPLGKSWQQPDRLNILYTDQYALISEEDFKLLPNYEISLPSGVYEGKMWRRYNLLCWYDTHPTDRNLCTIKSLRLSILIKPNSSHIPYSISGNAVKGPLTRAIEYIQRKLKK